jgi:type IV secretory pathway TraG/TraD family ATPase VirD4
MQSDSAVTLYIVTEPIDKDRLKPLIRVLINAIVRVNAMNAPKLVASTLLGSPLFAMAC